MNIPQYVTQLTKDWFRNVSKTRVQGTCIRIEDAEDSYTIGVDVEALKKLLDIDPQSADLSNVENGKIVVGESYTEGGVSKKRLTCVSDFAKDVDAMLIRTTGTNHKVEVDAKKVRFKSVLGSPVSGDFVCLDSNLNLTAVSPETKLQGYATANALAQVSATASSALDASSSAQSTASAANTTANSALDGLQTLQAAVDNNTTSIGLLDTEVGTINESLRQLIDVTIAQMDADIETAKTTAESAQTTAETFDGRIGDIEDDYLTSSDLFDANGNKLYVDTSTNQTVRGNKTFVGVTKHSNWVGWGGDATSSFHICGGDGWRDGSHLILSKNGHSGSGAGFSLVSSGGPNVKYHLLGNENGELTWDGSTQKSTDKSDKQLPTLGYLLQNFMTLETEQEITGRKRFSSTGTAISLNVFADGLEMFQFRKGGDADASALIYSPNQPIRIYASNKKILLESSSNNVVLKVAPTDLTATNSLAVPTMGWVNDKFLRKDKIGVSGGAAAYSHTHDGYGTVKKVLGVGPGNDGNVTGILGTGSNQAARGDHTHTHEKITDFNTAVSNVISQYYPKKTDFAKDSDDDTFTDSFAQHAHYADNVIIGKNQTNEDRLNTLFGGQLAVVKVDARNIKVAENGGLGTDENGNLKLSGTRTNGKFVAVSTDGKSFVTPDNQPSVVEAESAEAGELMAMTADGTLAGSGIVPSDYYTGKLDRITEVTWDGAKLSYKKQVDVYEDGLLKTPSSLAQPNVVTIDTPAIIEWK